MNIWKDWIPDILIHTPACAATRSGLEALDISNVSIFVLMEPAVQKGGVQFVPPLVVSIHAPRGGRLPCPEYKSIVGRLQPRSL